jgi:hypothetical protein
MVINTEGYIHLIEYLTEHIGLFEGSIASDSSAETVINVIEIELSKQIISVCGQNSGLSTIQRNAIIGEVDDIVHDLGEIFSGILNNPVTEEQNQFIKEFATLIKNLFDNEISLLLTTKT